MGRRYSFLEVGAVSDTAETIRRIVDARGINYWDEFMDYMREVGEDTKYVAGVFLGDERVDEYEYEYYHYLQRYADFIEFLLEELYGIRLRMYVVRHSGASSYSSDYYEMVAKRIITVVRNGEKYHYELDVYSEEAGLCYGSVEDFNSGTADLLERIKERYRAIADLLETRAHMRDTGSGWEYVTG